MPLLDELQSVLDLVVSCLESEDAGCVQATLTGLQQAHTQLTYARACSSSELDASTNCIVDEVCKGFLSTLAAKAKILKAHQLEQLAAIMEDIPEPQGVHMKAQSQMSDCSDFELPAKQPPISDPAQDFAIQEGNLELIDSKPAPVKLSKSPQQPLGQPRAVQGPNSIDLMDSQEQDGLEAVGSSAAAADSLEILQQCQRNVSGSLNDLSGLDDIKHILRSAVLWPLRLPHLFKGYRKPPKTFLLVGPPGTGKTMLVEKLAAEAGMVLLAVTPSSVLSKWSGESEKTIRSVFTAASAMQPSIVFIDEVDALAGQRTSGDDASSRRLLTELLIQMTASLDQDNLFVFACTNRIQGAPANIQLHHILRLGGGPAAANLAASATGHRPVKDCDSALLRRFERRILIPYPDALARLVFFKKALQRPEMSNDLSEDEVTSMVERTSGYSCSDLGSVCKEAAMAPVNEIMQASYQLTTAGDSADWESTDSKGPPSIEDDGRHIELRRICLRDFSTALGHIRPTAVDQAEYAG